MPTRFNSHIRIVRDTCIDCGVVRPIKARKRCEYHYRIHQTKVAQARAKERDVEYAVRRDELWEFYNEQRKLMTGWCTNCANRSLKDNDKMFHWSICHVLPKNIFKSIATHPDNWIELCNTCHAKYDRSQEFAASLKCFTLSRQKFELFKDAIAPDELRRIPQQFL